jgi:UDP-2,3-diacylglucosamine pyrophosphatase LpxH
MSYLVINDTHFGVSRMAGTTPESRAALKKFMLESITSLLNNHGRDDDLIILGDLFDSFTVDERDVLDVYNMLNNHLQSTGTRLYMVGGNHDFSARDQKLSSFHLLSAILKEQYSRRVVVIDKGFDVIDTGIGVVSHVFNQDLFDHELSVALEAMQSGSFLLLHANLDNNFATNSDHSLNVDREWIGKFRDKGVTLVFAHEHSWRVLDKIVVLGNQKPSSISDCIGAPTKYAWLIQGGGIKPIQTWEAEGSYMEVNWQELSDVDDNLQFIRVVGEAGASEAEAVINAISALRRKHKAFVISNAVKIEGMVEIDSLSDLNEDAIKSFNVLEALLAELNEREAATVKELMEL